MFLIGGILQTRLVHWTDERAVRERFADSIAYVCSLMGEVEIAIISAAEIAFRCHGLEFARPISAGTWIISLYAQIVFGVGAEERVLSEENNALFITCCEALGRSAMLKVRVIILYGDYIRRAGWNRWWFRMWVQ